MALPLFQFSLRLFAFPFSTALSRRLLLLAVFGRSRRRLSLVLLRLRRRSNITTRRFQLNSLHLRLRSLHLWLSSRNFYLWLRLWFRPCRISHTFSPHRRHGLLLDQPLLTLFPSLYLLRLARLLLLIFHLSSFIFIATN